jgi:hypothetical protein
MRWYIFCSIKVPEAVRPCKENLLSGWTCALADGSCLDMVIYRPKFGRGEKDIHSL